MTPARRDRPPRPAPAEGARRAAHVSQATRLASRRRVEVRLRGQLEPREVGGRPQGGLRHVGHTALRQRRPGRAVAQSGRHSALDAQPAVHTWPGAARRAPSASGGRGGRSRRVGGTARARPAAIAMRSRCSVFERSKLPPVTCKILSMFSLLGWINALLGIEGSVPERNAQCAA